MTFEPGKILTAADLNAALANYVPISALAATAAGEGGSLVGLTNGDTVQAFMAKLMGPTGAGIIGASGASSVQAYFNMLMTSVGAAAIGYGTATVKDALDAALQAAAANQGAVGTLTTAVSAGDTLPFEVSAFSGSFIGTGTGGTPGEYALVVSGGPAGHTAFITVGSDGKVASARIGARGIATANTAPTYSLPSGTGLTGATLPTPTVSAIPAGRIFLAPDANSSATRILGWTASAGVIAAWNVGGAQWSMPMTAYLDAFLTALASYQTVAFSQVNGYLVSATGVQTVSANRRLAKVALTGNERGLKISSFIFGSTSPLAAFFRDAACTTFLSASSQLGSSGGTTYTDELVPIPTGARGMLVNGTFIDRLEIKIARVDGVVTEVENANSTLQETIAGSPVITGSKTIAADGSIASNSSAYTIAEMDLDPNDTTATIKAWCVGTGNQLAHWYDASGTWLQSDHRRGGSPYTDYSAGVTLTKPAGAAKIKVNGSSSYVTTITTQRLAASVGSRLAATESGLSSAQSNVTILSNALEGYVAATPSLTDGKYIFTNGTTDSIGTNASFEIFTVPVPLNGSGARKCLVNGQFSGNTSTRYWDYLNDAGTVIGFGPAGDGTTRTYSQYEVTLPSGATTIRASHNKSLALAISVAGVRTDLPAKVDALSGVSSIGLLGDSTMETGGTTGIGDNIAAAYPTRSVYGYAIGGQRADQQAALINAIATTITVTGGVIPSDGSPVACTLSNDFLRKNGDVVGVLVLVANTICTLIFDYSANVGAGGYTIRATQTISANVAVAAGSALKVLTFWTPAGIPANVAANAVPLRTALSGIVLVRIGINDLAQNADAATTLSRLLAIDAELRKYTDKIVYFTVMPGGSDVPTSLGGDSTTISEATSYARLQNAIAFNRALANLFAGYVIRPEVAHKNSGGTQSLTVSGVAFDVMTLSASTVETSDGRHENAAGQTETTGLVTDFISAKGW